MNLGGAYMLGAVNGGQMRAVRGGEIDNIEGRSKLASKLIK